MREYPLIPKSTARLKPGDFWSVPLDDGRFACGRVLSKIPVGRRGARVAFWGGLQDWVGADCPTADAIAGTVIADAGLMHILSITALGGAVVGHSALTTAEKSACLCVDCGSLVLDPFNFVRNASDKDCKELFPYSAWGFNFIKLRANFLFSDDVEYVNILP